MVACLSCINLTILLQFYYGDVMYNFSIHDVIHEDFQDVPSNSTRPMLPTWQNVPFSPRWPAYNWDLLSQEYVIVRAFMLYGCRAILTITFLFFFGDYFQRHQTCLSCIRDE